MAEALSESVSYVCLLFRKRAGRYSNQVHEESACPWCCKFCIHQHSVSRALLNMYTERREILLQCCHSRNNHQEHSRRKSRRGTCNVIHQRYITTQFEDNQPILTRPIIRNHEYTVRIGREEIYVRGPRSEEIGVQ